MILDILNDSLWGKLGIDIMEYIQLNIKIQNKMCMILNYYVKYSSENIKSILESPMIKYIHIFVFHKNIKLVNKFSRCSYEFYCISRQ